MNCRTLRWLRPYPLHCLNGLLPLAGLCFAGLVAHGATEQTLFDFGPGFDLAGVRRQDASVAVATGADGRAGLQVSTGHSSPWPGVTLVAPEKSWDLSVFDRVTVDVQNPGSTLLKVFCRVDNEGANGTDHCVTDSVEVPPGRTGVLSVRLTRYAGDTLNGLLFGLRGYPVRRGGSGTVDPARITQLLFFLHQPREDSRFVVRSVRAEGVHVAPTAWVTDADPYLPLMDTFGQYRHKDWPGKLHSAAELEQRRDSEAAALAQDPGPTEWNRYGGWAAGPSLRATGYFRTEKHEGRWWLVDPEGRLFFSHGIDCVRMLDSTPVEGREAWFQAFPGSEPDLAGFLGTGFALKGHYAGKSPSTFSFAGANFRRKYGPAWRERTAEVIHRRLRSWGLNTIGMWSDEAVRLLRRTPYVDAIGSHGARQIEGSEGYWSKFPDVFDASFAEGLRRGMEGRRGKSAGDPWCIGYFADNEMSWGDELSLAEAVLKSPRDQAAKAAFASDLRATHGTIERLNAAWGTAHVSWEALMEARVAPDRARARSDLERFYTRLAEQYFRSVRDAIKSVAPQQLYLGCRFAWANDRAAAAAARFCDIVSYNLYQRSVAAFEFRGGADVPLIIGEFHFGALDRGLFHTGLVPVADQEARAAAYRSYVEGALRHPQFVGCHWFQYQDEPTTGRVYDEENYQIGFVDIADTPYAETTRASRMMGGRMYGVRSGPR